MFRLSKYKDKILEWLKTFPIVPEYRNQEMINFVSEGLKDLSISRKKSVTEWGIEVPGNSDNVIYVWLDALTNYKTAANNDRGKNIFLADIYLYFSGRYLFIFFRQIFIYIFPADIHVVGF